MGKRTSSAPRDPRSRSDALERAEALFAARYPPRPEPGPPEVVDPGWLLKAGAVALAAALVCAYATLCLLVYQGQWQLLLRPVPGALPTVDPSQQTVHFGAGVTGQPELTGLWLPAADSTPNTPTLLYLASGSGNLAADTTALRELHQLSVNILAFDYRGFGASFSSEHPTEARMTEDAESALNYLLNTRHLSPMTIVPYGVGLGASLAAVLCQHHGTLPAVILESPDPSAAQAALNDSRSRWVPLRFFLHERFDLPATLSTLKTPKLLLDAGPSSPDMTVVPAAFTQLARSVAQPSMTVHLAAAGGPPSPALWRGAITRFLDEYLYSLAMRSRGSA